jgi:hypothetical protein
MAEPITLDKLQDGDEIRFERSRKNLGAPSQWDLRITRNGNDAGVLATVPQNEVIDLQTGGKKFSLAIPSAMGMDPADNIPKISITGDSAPVIRGGDYVLLKGKAIAIAAAEGMREEPALNKQATSKSPKDSISISYINTAETDGRTRTVTVGPEAEIRFSTSDKADPFFVLSGNKVIAENVAAYQKIQRQKDVAPAPSTTKSPDGSKPGLSAAEQEEIRGLTRKVSEALAKFPEMRGISKFLDAQPAIKSQIDTAAKAAGSMLQGNRINPDSLASYRASMDAAIDATEAQMRAVGGDIPNASLLSKKLKDSRNEMEARFGITPTQAASRLDGLLQNTSATARANSPDLEPLMKDAQSIAGTITSGDGSLNRPALESFNQKLDALLEKRDTLPGPWFVKEIEDIKKKLSSNPDLKISQAPGLIPEAALAAASDAARTLTAFTEVVDYGSGKGQGNKASPMTEAAAVSPVRRA